MDIKVTSDGDADTVRVKLTTMTSKTSVLTDVVMSTDDADVLLQKLKGAVYGVGFTS